MINILELGSGINYYKAKEGEEVVHTDIRRLPHIEELVDFNDKLPFCGNTFDKVIATHVLEHTKDLEFTIKEVHRVLKSGGVLYVKVPCWGNKASNYEYHTRFFRYLSLIEFSVNEESDARDIQVKFNVLSRRFIYNKNRLIGRFLEWFANKYPQYENQYCGSFPVKPFEFEYVLEAIKESKT